MASSPSFTHYHCPQTPHRHHSIAKYLLVIVLFHNQAPLSLTLTKLPEETKLAVPAEISHKLHDDPEALELASRDYGNIVKEVPSAILRPSSISDIVNLIQFSYNNSVPFTISARGEGHSTSGQAMARDGVVVDMAELRRQGTGHGISVSEDPSLGYYADVGGEQLWIDVLHATLEFGLAPLSWTDYLYLTVGGTLSNAGISGQTFKHGPQISNVYEMDVITGKGELVTCSAGHNSELFYAVLGGLGQFGIITRARISLGPATKRVKWVRLLYDDFSAFTKDQEKLISINALDYLEGMILIHQDLINKSSFFPLSDHSRIISLLTKHKILYCLEVAKYYEHNVDKELRPLLHGLSYVPEFYYEKDVSYVNFLNRVQGEEQKLKLQGLWEVPHPWLNLFIPKSRILDFDLGVFKDIVLKGFITRGPLLVYPMNRNKWDNRMSASVPDEDVFYTVGFLQSSGFDNWKDLNVQNREILQFCDDSGIKVKPYLRHYSTQEDWKSHYDNKWRTFQERKDQFDPRMILSPGQKIFNMNELSGVDLEKTIY